MNRIVERFDKLKQAKQKGFVVYMERETLRLRPRASSRSLSIKRASIFWNSAFHSAIHWRTAWSISSRRSAA